VCDDPERRALAQPRHDVAAAARARPAWHITRVRTTNRTCGSWKCAEMNATGVNIAAHARKAAQHSPHARKTHPQTRP
jgi:hypothetical protein